MSKDPLLQENRKPVFAFVIGGALILLIIVSAFAREQGWFEDTFKLQFRTDTAEGLKKGMGVRLSGLNIGSVSKFTLDDDARVTVSLKINTEYRRWIRNNSKAVLAREGMFGDGYIQITTGNMQLAEIADNSMLAFDPGTDFSVLLLQLRERIFPLLENADKLVQNLNNPEGELRGLLQEMRKLFSDLHKTRAEIDRTLAGASKLTQQQVPATLQGVDKTMRDFSQLAAQTDAKLSAISAQLQTTLDKYESTGGDAQKTVQEMQQMIHDLRPQLQQVMRDADVLIRNSNQTMNNMQEHWPFTSDKAIPAAEMPPQGEGLPKP